MDILGRGVMDKYMSFSCVFEPSSPSRPVAELTRILVDKVGDSHILFLYTDGGPDHRLTYASDKENWI